MMTAPPSTRSCWLAKTRLLQTLDLSDEGDQLVVSTDGGMAIWYDLEGIDAWQIAEPGTGFDAQFVEGDRVAVVGSDGARIMDPRTRRSGSVGSQWTRRLYALRSTHLVGCSPLRTEEVRSSSGIADR